MSDKPKVDTLFVHEPLPYVATVKIVSDEDAPPETREIKTTAYSIFEAMIQASMECGSSGLEDQKIKVTAIAPDLAAYAEMLKLAAESK